MKKGENMKKFFCVLCGICLFYMGYAQEKEVKAVIETNLGNMIVKLYNDTPNHRDNFVRLAKAGHYDGSLFYRVQSGTVNRSLSMRKSNRSIITKKEH